MDAYEKRFLEKLTYVDYIKDDKVNIPIFLSGLLLFTGIRFGMICPITFKK